MLGRAAWHDLWLLAEVDPTLFGDTMPPPERSEVAAAYLAYARRQADARLGELVRPLLGLFRGVPGARRWRRTLGELAHRRDATVDIVARACELLTAGSGSEPVPERARAGPDPRVERVA